MDCKQCEEKNLEAVFDGVCCDCLRENKTRNSNRLQQIGEITMIFTNEEWDAAVETEEYKVSKQQWKNACDKAMSPYLKKAKKLQQKEDDRILRAFEAERKKARDFQEKIKILEGQAEEAGNSAINNLAFKTIEKIVAKMRRDYK